MEHHHHHRHSPQTADQDKLEKDPGIHRHVSKGRKEKSHVHSDDGGQQHDKHAGHHTADFLKRFWICLGLTIPVLLLSHMIQQWLGFSFSFKGEQYLLLGLGTIIYAYGGWPFISGMSREIKFRAIGMMTLVALAISVAYIYSVAVVFGLQGMDFFWELATLIDIMLLGHWLEMRSQSAASRALESLVELLPAVVHIEKNGEVVDASLKELKNEDIILVKPGEKIPADGMVLEGHSSVNESMLTGESFPVAKEKDTKLIAGSVNGDGILRVRVTGTGKDSYLDKVIAMVQSAQQAKSKTQNLADRVAKWLTIISISIGILTFGYWYWVETNLAFALERMVTVMVTACPHALGVAIPLVVAISTSLSARSGLLIRNRTAFENARKLSTIIFDKTGTLTRGSHEVQKIISVNGDYSTDELLQYVAAVQQYSEHHIAKGIMKKIKDSQLPLWESKDFSYRQGVGVSGLVKGKKVMAAGPNFYSSMGKPLPALPAGIEQSIESVIFILIDETLSGILTLADTIRENSREAIARLKEMQIKSFLLTGDNDKVAAAVAGQLDMDGWMANVLPHDKQKKVKELQDRGEYVAMTGDGVNDAPALAAADIGIAIGSGTDVAAETADIILVNSDPMDVVNMISFGKTTYRKMMENLAWATGYNIIAIPLAAGVLYPYFILSPALGAVLMSLSTIIVAFNARLLKFKK